MSAAGIRGAAFDRLMMAAALRMAVRGLGTTAFNPSVGAVVADEATGELIARGWTQPSGRPHAEKEALRRAGDRARGKTLYVTLEPCAHTGRIPTCADAVLTAGLKRVVCALPDPNPIVAGRGFAQLRAAGVAVDVGLMADEARAITWGHISHVTRRRPFVQLKLAVSANGRVAPGEGAPVFVTGPEARAQVHLMRARSDLLISGIGTVRADDPRLDCRLPGLEARAPHRLIVDSRLSIDRRAKCLASDADRAAGRKVWIASSAAAAAGPTAKALRDSGRVHDILAIAGAPLELNAIFAALANEPIRRVMVEAGPKLARSFLAADLVDEVVLFRGTGALSLAGSLAPLADLPFPETFEAPDRWARIDERAVGSDRMTIYRRISI